MIERKIIQIAAIPCARADINTYTAKYNPTCVYALCDDGTVWVKEPNEKWSKVESIPQY